MFDRSNQSDHLRRQPNTNGSTAITSKSSTRASGLLCDRTKTYSNTAMRMSSDIGNTNDRVEGCGLYDCFDVRRQRGQSRLHSRFPQSSSRRSHRRTQNQFDCMWIEIHHPASIYHDVGSAREYLYQNLMRHTRKMSSLRELKSCLEITLVMWLGY